MVARVAMATAAIVSAFAPAAGATELWTLYHQPPARIASGQELTLDVEVTPHWAAPLLHLYYRAVGAPEFRHATLDALGDGRFVARIPGAHVAPGLFEYYVVAEEGRTVRAQFGTPAEPYRVHVLPSSSAVTLQRELLRTNRQRAYFAARADYLQPGGTDMPLQRYTLSFGYRILRALHGIEFGLGLVRGAEIVDRRNIGLNYGWGELQLQLHEWAYLDLRLFLGIGGVGFELGGGATLIVGNRYGTHASVAIDAITHVGFELVTKLETDTLRFARLATLIIFTTLPGEGSAAPTDGGGLTAIELCGEIGVPLGSHLLVTARAGWGARTPTQGGPVLGLRAAYGF